MLGYAASFLVVHGREGLGTVAELQPVVSWAMNSFSMTILTRTIQAWNRLAPRQRMCFEMLDPATRWWLKKDNPIVKLAAGFGGVHVLELCQVKVRVEVDMLRAGLLIGIW